MAAFYLLSAPTETGVIQPWYPTNWQGGWTSPGSVKSAVRSLDTLKDGGINGALQVSINSATNPFRAPVVCAITRRLAAQTISGTLDVILAILESNAAADFFWKVYAYVSAGETDTVRGVLLDYEATTVEWPTALTGTALPAAQTLTAVVAQAGDRLVVELGVIKRHAISTLRTATIRRDHLLRRPGHGDPSDQCHVCRAYHPDQCGDRDLRCVGIGTDRG